MNKYLPAVKALALAAVLAACDNGHADLPPIIEDCFLGVEGTAQIILDLREVAIIEWKHDDVRFYSHRGDLVGGVDVVGGPARKSIEDAWRQCRRSGVR